MNIELVKRFLTDPRYRFVALAEKGFLNWMPDKIYLKKKFKLVMGEKLDFSKPESFNQKLQWLKVYDRKPEYTQMVDKYEAKKIIAEKIGEKYVIPTYGVWDHFDDIDFDALPDQFVLKTTHDSGGVVICKDKSSFDKEKARKKLEPRLQQNFYWHGREWPYKNVKPKILAEALLVESHKADVDENDYFDSLNDYKFMCFNGKVKCCFMCTDRFSADGLHVTFYDNEWNIMPFDRHYPRVRTGLPKPKLYEEMVCLAEKLSAGIKFLRVDFYEVNSKVYTGELTFFPGSGFEEFIPAEWDYILGSWIQIP